MKVPSRFRIGTSAAGGPRGRGIFATSEIGEGELIHRMVGRRLALRALLDCFDPGPRRHLARLSFRLRARGRTFDDPLQICADTILLLDATTLIFNHGCEPNAFIRGEAEFTATRTIRPGEEIVFDYSTTSPLWNKWTMGPCKCASSRCRETIGSIGTVPAASVDAYVERREIPDFMLAEPSSNSPCPGALQRNRCETSS